MKATTPGKKRPTTGKTTFKKKSEINKTTLKHIQEKPRSITPSREQTTISNDLNKNSKLKSKSKEKEKNAENINKQNHKISKRVEDVLKLNLDGSEKKLINFSKSMDFHKKKRKIR